MGYFGGLNLGNWVIGFCRWAYGLEEILLFYFFGFLFFWCKTMKSIQKVFIEKEKKKKPIWRNEIGMGPGLPL